MESTLAILERTYFFSNFMTRGIKIGIGFFMEMDTSSSVGIDKSIRIWVAIDVRKPLQRMVRLKDCEEVREKDDPELKFGTWLKASPWKNTEKKDGVNQQKEESNLQEAGALLPDQIKKKKWCRVLRKGSGGTGDIDVSAGSKRNVSHGETNECRDIDIEESIVTKKRGVDSSNENVAGPTPWALSTQCAIYWLGTVGAWGVPMQVVFTGVHGYPEEVNKFKTGVLMEKLAEGNHLPWICGGDFNLMLQSSEKQGGKDFDAGEAVILQQAIDKCQLVDLGFDGHPFTWSNNKGGDGNL
ncbi:Histidinol-phosphate aminotransferase [Bienertia sinuspersici]